MAARALYAHGNRLGVTFGPWLVTYRKGNRVRVFRAGLTWNLAQSAAAAAKRGGYKSVKVTRQYPLAGGRMRRVGART